MEDQRILLQPVPENRKERHSRLGLLGLASFSVCIHGCLRVGRWTVPQPRQGGS